MCVTKLLSLRPRQHVSFFVQKRSFFHLFRPTVYEYPVTENASFQNAFQRGDFWKRQLLVHTWTDENGGLSIYGDVRSRSIGSWMMSYIIYYACSVRNAIEITPFNCFRVRGRKRFKYATCGRVFFFSFKIGGIFGYV